MLQNTILYTICWDEISKKLVETEGKLESHQELSRANAKLKKNNQILREKISKQRKQLDDYKAKAEDPESFNSFETINCQRNKNPYGPLTYQIFKIVIDFVGWAGVPESGCDKVYLFTSVKL